MTNGSVKIPLRVLEKVPYGLNGEEITRWIDGETRVSLEIEDEKIIIPLKITRIGNKYCNKQKWRRADRKFAAFSLETKNIKFLDKNKEVRVDNLTIVWKDNKNKIGNINDILSEEAEIKLKLGSDWCLRERNDDVFSLEIYSDYEIITPNRTITFPKLDWENSNNQPKTPPEKILSLLTYWEEISLGYRQRGFLASVSQLISLLKNEISPAKKIKELENFLEKYENSDIKPLTELVKEWKKEEGLEENNSPPSQKKQEILNNLSKYTLENSGNFRTRGNLIKLSSQEEKEVREALIEQIKQNPSQWRIEKLNVRYQDGPYPYTTEYRQFFYDIFLIHKSAKIKQLEKNSGKNKKEKILTKVDYGKIHYKRGFASKEWKEIENILSQNRYTPLKEWLEEYIEPSQENNWDWKTITLYGIVGVLVILAIGWLVMKIKGWFRQ